MTAPIARPGGWVPGIGWVALLGDLNPNDACRVYDGYAATSDYWNPRLEDGYPVVVTRWADGTVPTECDR